MFTDSRGRSTDQVGPRPSKSPFLDLVAQRVVVYDGATGTWLQTQDLTLDDYGGEALEGCTDYLG
ncbi:MAG: hypothetical protein KF906_12450, partial [Actinobacteria bacterium]|nr:hypothetical protein [Actinomycetota bacterium]